MRDVRAAEGQDEADEKSAAGDAQSLRTDHVSLPWSRRAGPAQGARIFRVAPSRLSQVRQQ